VAYDLAQNSTWRNAQQYANIRGEDNPIFSGALGVYDGVIVHEHEGITTADNLGGGDAVKAAQETYFLVLELLVMPKLINELG
jgi:hypothetical protein